MMSQKEGSPATPSGRQAIAVSAVKVGLCVVALLLIAFRAAWLPLHNPAVDYDKHWYAARAILQGESPYLGDLYLAFNYPLFAGWLYLPLGWFDLAGAFQLWTAMKLLEVLLGLALIAWLLRPRAEEIPEAPPADPEGRLRLALRAWWVPLVLLLFANYQPMHVARIAGNIEPVIFLFVTLALVLVVRGRDGWGGAALAAAVLVKLAPVFILIPLAAMRRWRAVGACLAVLVFYGVVLLVTGAWRTEMVLYREVLPAIPYHWQIISMSVHHTLADLAFPGLLESETGFRRYVFVLNAAMMAIYLALVGAWCMTRPEGRDGVNMLAFGTFMVPVFTPLLEINHFLWIFGAYFLHLLSYARGGLGIAPLAAVSVAFSGVVMMQTVTWWANRWWGFTEVLPGHFFHTLVLLLLVAASGWCAFSRRRAEPTPATEQATAA